MTSKRITIPRHLTARDAILLQRKLASLVCQQSVLPKEIRYVAGTDGAYGGDKAVGAAAVIDCDSLEPVEIKTAQARVTFPYIPGLLAFREAPVVVRALRKLRRKPDVCIVDGHGLAHPRKFGLACCVGVVMNLPTIGVAKSRLFGTEVGETLVDAEGNMIATILRHKRKSLYVSVGHKISLEDATRIVKHCLSERGLEPVVLAHLEAKKLKWSLRT
ncbi:endonuclease V [[Eubacterium] cellulosolvens]